MSCPKCGSDDYYFQRKEDLTFFFTNNKLDITTGNTKKEKFHCEQCSYEWKE